MVLCNNDSKLTGHGRRHRSHMCQKIALQTRRTSLPSSEDCQARLPVDRLPQATICRMYRRKKINTQHQITKTSLCAAASAKQACSHAVIYQTQQSCQHVPHEWNIITAS